MEIFVLIKENTVLGISDVECLAANTNRELVQKQMEEDYSKTLALSDFLDIEEERSDDSIFINERYESEYSHVQWKICSVKLSD